MPVDKNIAKFIPFSTLPIVVHVRLRLQAGKLRMHWGIWTRSKAARTVNTRLPWRHDICARMHARWHHDLSTFVLVVLLQHLCSDYNSHYSTQKMNPWTAIRSECTVIWQWDQIYILASAVVHVIYWMKKKKVAHSIESFTFDFNCCPVHCTCLWVLVRVHHKLHLLGLLYLWPPWNLCLRVLVTVCNIHKRACVWVCISACVCGWDGVR